MKVLYSNISGGLLFAGSIYGEMLFSKVALDEYINYFRRQNADILSLSEIHLESKNESEMVARIARELNMPYHSCLALSESHLDTSKQMGMAVISCYPIINQTEFKIPSPGLEVTRPNGDHWKMFDKGGQRVHLDIDGRTIALVNFSYFPFHHFGRRVDEPAFKTLRQELLDVLLAGDINPTIITGDFNNKGILLNQAFPELLENDTLAQAVRTNSTVIGCEEQLDHILYQPQFFTASNQLVEKNASDHLAIGTTLDFIPST
jgi:endonuclease/exonuclease/phosphatase family metal-dependent hydrolase